MARPSYGGLVVKATVNSPSESALLAALFYIVQQR